MKAALDKLITFNVMVGMSIGGVGLYEHDLLYIVTGALLMLAGGVTKAAADNVEETYKANIDGLE